MFDWLGSYLATDDVGGRYISGNIEPIDGGFMTTFEPLGSKEEFYVNNPLGITSSAYFKYYAPDDVYSPYWLVWEGHDNRISGEDYWKAANLQNCPNDNQVPL